MAGNAAVVTNLAIFQGEDKVFQDQIYQADGVTAQDITNWAVSVVVHAYGDPITIFFTLTVGSGVTLVPPTTAGILQFTVAAALTTGMFPGEYEWRCERTDSGQDAVLSRGLFTILAK